MNKKQQISFWKKIEDAAIKMEAVSRQNLQLATQSKVEAKRALELLGSSPVRSRKANVLSEEVQIHLIASLTKGSEQSA